MFIPQSYLAHPLNDFRITSSKALSVNSGIGGPLRESYLLIQIVESTLGLDVDLILQATQNLIVNPVG